MGWGYEDYLTQPAWFTRMLLELMRAEAHELNRRNPH